MHSFKNMLVGFTTMGSCIPLAIHLIKFLFQLRDLELNIKFLINNLLCLAVCKVGLIPKLVSFYFLVFDLLPDITA